MQNNIRQLDPQEYPAALREIPGMPKRLWLRGDLPAKGTKYLTVVGSRALTPYGKEAVEKLIDGLCGYPISIVSGLALGADAVAHRAALSAGLHTIAIPGSGLADHVIGPRTNAPLAKEIISHGGALLSEHEADYRAHPYDFPSRNRIMVGLADAVLVVEAGERSGTLITARLTSEYNRELLCIPHRIGDPHGFGAHLFLRLGATLITDPLHILEALKITPNEITEEHPTPDDLSENEQILCATLNTPLARDELIRASRLSTSEALTALVSLELRGVLKEEFGLWRRT